MNKTTITPQKIAKKSVYDYKNKDIITSYELCHFCNKVFKEGATAYFAVYDCLIICKECLCQGPIQQKNAIVPSYYDARNHSYMMGTIRIVEEGE